MNPMQRELLASAMKKLPEGGTLLIATDNNTGGTHLVASIREIAGAATRPDLGLDEHRPEREGQDWNNVLKTMEPSASPARRAGKEPQPCLKP